MTLRRINPEELSGPRAYYTEWANQGLRDADTIERECRYATRRLKALLLTKTTIVFTATHLDSPVAQQILKKYPILLNKGILMPALREERTGIEEVTSDQEMKRFLKDTDVTAVSWKLEAGESWFKERLCHELLDNNSVIRSVISNSSPNYDPKSLVEEILVTDKSIQTVVELHANQLEGKAKTALHNYRELLYHVSGARVVRCESFFPQENLIDYDFLSEKARMRLSEETIFTKIFIEQAMKTLNRKSIPMEVLDSLEIHEILVLREIIEQTGFMKEYDKLMACAIQAATNRDPRETIFQLERLERSRSRIFEDFTLVFETEIAKFMRLKRISTVTSLFSPVVSVALGSGGVALPGVKSLICSLLSLAKDSANLGEALASIINSLSIFSGMRDLEVSKNIQERKTKLLKKKLRSLQTGNSMLDIADLYTALVSETFRC